LPVARTIAEKQVIGFAGHGGTINRVKVAPGSHIDDPVGLLASKLKPYDRWVGGLTMSVEDMPDERLVRYYENVRQQVEADRAGNHKFMMNPTVQQYADQLQSEMIKRGLEHSPIEWPQEMARKHRD
jgi:hypothetical protein